MPWLVWLVAAVLISSGCRFDTRARARADAGGSPDALAGDGSTPVDAPAGMLDHLVLSEIKNNGDSRREELIEIYNPTAAPITLTGVYLADSPHYPNLPAIAAGNLSVTIGDDDFIARFPAGAAVAPGGVVVVALRAPFGLGDADFSIRGRGNTPPMEEGFNGSIGDGAALTDDLGEAVALFYWDGAADLVADIDLMIAGRDPAGPDDLVDKSGLTVDGPDFNDLASSYRDDALAMPALERALEPGESYQRIAFEIGEVGSGGNGVTGHDETTEDVRQSWVIAAPTPGGAAF